MDKDSELSTDSGDERPRKSAYKQATKPAPKTRATLLRRGKDRPKKRSKSKVSTLDRCRRMNALDKKDSDPEYTEEEEDEELETGKKKEGRTAKRGQVNPCRKETNPSRKEQIRHISLDEDGDEDTDLDTGSEPARRTKRWNNDIMEKTKDGKVEISKNSFNPYLAKEQRDWTRQMLGGKISDLSGEQIEEIEDWYEHLRIQSGNYCRQRVREEMLKIVVKANIGYRTLKEVSIGWAAATYKEARLETGELLHKMCHSGFFAIDGEWQKVIEAEFLDKYDLVYSQDSSKKAFLQIQSTRSKCDVYKWIQSTGKTKHGYIVSKKGSSYKRKRKGDEVLFDPSFIQLSQKPNPKTGSSKVVARKKKSTIPTLALLSQENVIDVDVIDIDLKNLNEEQLVEMTDKYMAAYDKCLADSDKYTEASKVLMNERKRRLEDDISKRNENEDEAKKLTNDERLREEGERKSEARFGEIHKLSKKLLKKTKKGESDSEDSIGSECEEPQEENMLFEPIDNEDEDDLEEIISFKFGKNNQTRMFEIKWKSGDRSWGCAMHVVGDWPEAAITYLWNFHRQDIQVLDWVNKAKEIKRKVKGFVDIEKFAWERKLEGAIAPVVEAVAPVAPRAAETVTLATTLGATKPAGTHPPKVIIPRPGTALKDMKAATEANPPPAIAPTPPARAHTQETTTTKVGGSRTSSSTLFCSPKTPDEDTTTETEQGGHVKITIDDDPNLIDGSSQSGMARVIMEPPEEIVCLEYEFEEILFQEIQSEIVPVFVDRTKKIKRTGPGKGGKGKEASSIPGMDRGKDNEAANLSDISLTDYDTDTSWMKGLKPVCTWSHRWEELHLVSYVTTGCLKGRYCYECKVRFVDGLRSLPWLYYKPGGHDLGNRCMDCGIAVCTPCRNKYDMASPPRRADLLGRRSGNNRPIAVKKRALKYN